MRYGDWQIVSCRIVLYKENFCPLSCFCSALSFTIKLIHYHLQ
ncbi:hypothetical protein HMPREF0868_0061 [Mageeibacillus indolicus UPII9-5]|uniref:Uncharacterized protein n=1 Tax=Mageeibacillus indolicus (strain UPII9-5) TaxID=699246 RepID=D3QZR0_MAGIU|nr:hypothetical protein HMPREF0868_0061 [Mageeibacillus indolicus UPII9-5]